MTPTDYHYGNFPPKKKNLDWHKLSSLAGKASRALARYDGQLSALPDPDILRAPLSTREAVLSSRIEGIQSNVSEVLEFEADPDTKKPPEHVSEIMEILNCRRALARCCAMLEHDNLPLSDRVILQAHQVLMDGVRGGHRAPGEYRKIANWIGRAGTPKQEASYVPISAEKIPEAMSRFWRYTHAQDQTDDLVRIAILHAEFECIHPFLDGNGRVGRMLIPLMLWQKGLMSRPVFYMSSYLEKNRPAYYNSLKAVSQDADWTRWCAFFLQGVKEEAKDNMRKVSAIQELYAQCQSDWRKLLHSQYILLALDWMFSQPVFLRSTFAKETGIPAPTARRMVGLLCKAGFLEVWRKSSGRRPGIYAFTKLMDLIQVDDVFRPG